MRSSPQGGSPTSQSARSPGSRLPMEKRNKRILSMWLLDMKLWTCFRHSYFHIWRCFPRYMSLAVFFLPLDIQVNGGVLDLAYTQHSSKRVRKGGAIYGLTMALPRILRNPANSFSAALRYRMLFKFEGTGMQGNCGEFDVSSLVAWQSE